MRYDLVVIGNDPDGLDAAMEHAVAGERVAVVARLEGCIAARLDLFAVDVVAGRPRFVGEHVLLVERDGDAASPGGTLRFEASRFVVGTGGTPWRPAYVPFDGERILDSDEIGRARGRTVVVGSAPFGLVRAEWLAERGLETMVVDGPEAGLDRDDDGRRPALLDRLRAHRVRLALGNEAIGFDRTGERVLVLLEHGHRILADTVVVAAGVEGHTAHLDLPKIGIVPDERGRLWCDHAGRTWLPHVSAVGDVVGHRTAPPVIDEADQLLPFEAPHFLQRARSFAPTTR
jgi:NAD(P) transhydrogenase